MRLTRDLQTGALVDQPAITRERYATAGPPAQVPVTISSPANGATVGSSTTVSGTTTPGARVAVDSAQLGSPTHGSTVVGTAAPNGQFSVTVPTASGSDVITVAPSTGVDATGWAQVSVTSS